MNGFSDTSDEMNPNGLTPDAAERLCNGEIDSPEFSDLAAVVSELRALPAQESTPVPGAALSEFVGASLVTNEIPVTSTPGPSIDLRPIAGEAVSGTTRRKSVFAQLAAFAGTLGGKAALCGAVAAASVTGAHATGVVDVPGLPDVKQEQVETIDTELANEGVEVAEFPDAVAAVDEGPTEEELKAQQEAEEEAERLAEEKAEQEAKEQAEKEAAEKAEQEAKEEAEKEAEEAELAEQKAKEEAEEKAAAEAKAKAEAEAKAKAEAEAKAKAEQEAKEHDGKLDDDTAAKLTALEEQLHKDKEAVRAEATEKIKKLEAELAGLVEELAVKIEGINEEYEGYIADIEAEIEAAETEGEKAEWEAYLETKYGYWADAVDAKEEAYAPYMEAVEKELEEVELNRDAEIDKLIKAFLEESEAIKAGK